MEQGGQRAHHGPAVPAVSGSGSGEVGRAMVCGRTVARWGMAGARVRASGVVAVAVTAVTARAVATQQHGAFARAGRHL